MSSKERHKSQNKIRNRGVRAIAIAVALATIQHELAIAIVSDKLKR